MTFAGAVRPVGGGTMGGLVNIALIGAPCGGPKSPAAEPPVSVVAASGATVATSLLDVQPVRLNNAVAIMSVKSERFIKPPLEDCMALLCACCAQNVLT